ncbi:uncharacterized protein O3C94_020071 [Discoglossus pictus]
MKTMCALLQVTIFLCSVAMINGNCLESCHSVEKPSSLGTHCTVLQWSELKNCSLTTLVLSKNSIEIIETSHDSTFKNITHFFMTKNNLKHLPDNFLHDAVDLLSLNLSYNKLISLPTGFLKNSSILKNLSLEGNSLSSIPSSVISPVLESLTVDCECNVARAIIDGMPEHCKNTTDCTLQVKCQKDSRWYNMSDFYQEECSETNLPLVLYIVVPIVALALIVGGIILYLCHRKKKLNFVSKSTSDKSPAHSQPRYMTRNVDIAPNTSEELRDPRQDYENVIVGYRQSDQVKSYDYLERPKKKSVNSNDMIEEDIYLESDVNDQPIYNNTQAVYYSYTEHGPMDKEEDDVYIIPDQ